MPLHAFVDESIRNGYLLSAAVIATGDLAPARGKLRELRKPGQRRLHMKDENDSRRREILSTLAGLAEQLAARGRFTWLHSAPAADPLLWAADAAGWAYGKSGDWRRRVEGIVLQVTDLP
jgi:hypothetical protein